MCNNKIRRFRVKIKEVITVLNKISNLMFAYTVCDKAIFQLNNY